MGSFIRFTEAFMILSNVTPCTSFTISRYNETMKKGSVLRAPFSEEITPTKGLPGMENENKREYDYSKLYQDGGQPAPAPEIAPE